MNDTPLIFTARGNVPIDTLRYEHRWEDAPDETTLYESWFAEDGELVAMSQKSQAIRTDLNEIPNLGRATQGVRVMKLREGDFLASFVVFPDKNGHE